MEVEINIEEIQEFLPHRYPMLLVDRVTNMVLGESIKAYKNITTNEPFFMGHFPGKKVMPGVLIIESMAQTSGALVVSSFGTKAMGKLVYFMSIDKARFRQLVVPGDQLFIEVKKKQARKLVWKFDCIARVETKIVGIIKNLKILRFKVSFFVIFNIKGMEFKG